MLKRYVLLGVTILILSAGTLSALEVTGSQVTVRTDKVMKAIDWAGPLSAVEARAQKEKKLVFWLQLVGDLDGGL
jgi:hypothetical protein